MKITTEYKNLRIECILFLLISKSFSTEYINRPVCPRAHVGCSPAVGTGLGLPTLSGSGTGRQGLHARVVSADTAVIGSMDSGLTARVRVLARTGFDSPGYLKIYTTLGVILSHVIRGEPLVHVSV